MTSAANDRLFIEHLRNSHTAVWFVAHAMWSRGYEVRIPPTLESPSHAEWKDYADDGDLYISGQGLENERIEVKCRSLKFSNRSDWPHPDFMVCAKHSWDRASPKPLGYIVLSSDMQHCGIVSGDSYARWSVVEKTDRRYAGDYKQKLYVANLNDVVFKNLRTIALPRP